MDTYLNHPWVYKWVFNWFPCYRRTGARVLSISDNWREVRVIIPLNWKTRNYVGTIFGGSMYAAVDPVYMMMLIKILGEGYVVWDKASNIKFRKPGRTDLFVDFYLEEEEIQSICEELEHTQKIDRVYAIQIVDEAGVVHADIEKVVHIRNK